MSLNTYIALSVVLVYGALEMYLKRKLKWNSAALSALATGLGVMRYYPRMPYYESLLTASALCAVGAGVMFFIPARDRRADEPTGIRESPWQPIRKT